MSTPQPPDDTMHGADGDPLDPQPANDVEDVNGDEG